MYGYTLKPGRVNTLLRTRKKKWIGKGFWNLFLAYFFRMRKTAATTTTTITATKMMPR